MFMFGFILFILLAVFMLMLLSSCIRVVPQARALVIERMGAYLDTWEVGLHFAVPFIDRAAKKVARGGPLPEFRYSSRRGVRRSHD